MANGTSQTTGALGNLILRQQRRAVERVSETRRHRDRPGTRTSITPAFDTRETIQSGLAQGILNLEADVQTFGAIGNILLGNEEAGARRLNEARNLQDDAQLFGQRVPTFEEALENPTFEGFWQQGVVNIARVAPMMATTALSAGAGGIVGGLVGTATNTLSRMGVSKAGRAAAKEVIEELTERKTRGEVLDAAEDSLLRGAWREARRPKIFAQRGAATGAFSESYVVGSSQSLQEFQEAGYEISREEAAIAAILGIPQAALDSVSEIFFAKAMFTNAIRRTALGTILNKQRAGQALSEAEKGLVGILAKRKAGETLTASELKSLTNAAGKNTFVGTLAKDIARNVGKSSVGEGVTETAQEGLQILQRFQIDDEYTQSEARLRLGEAAFAGTLAGTGRGAAGGALASVFSQARDMVLQGYESQYAREARAQQLGDVYKVVPESQEQVDAQRDEILDPASPKRSMWVPKGGPVPTGLQPETAPETDSSQLDLFDGEPVTLEQQQPQQQPQQQQVDANQQDLFEGTAASPAPAQPQLDLGTTKLPDIQVIETPTGTLYTTDQLTAESFFRRMDEAPTEDMLRDVLGYSETRQPNHNYVVRVLNPQGEIVHEETTSTENAPTVREKLEQRYKDNPGYRVPAPVPIRQVLRERNMINSTIEDQILEQAPEMGEFDTLEEGGEVIGEQTGLDFADADVQVAPTEYVVQKGKGGETILDPDTGKPIILSWAPSGKATPDNKKRFLDSLSREERVLWETDERGRKRSVAEGEEQILTKVDTLSDSVINAYFKALEEYPGGVFITALAVPGKLAIAKTGAPSPETDGQAKVRQQKAVAQAVTKAVQLASKGNYDGTNLLPGWELHDTDAKGNPRVRAVDPGHLAREGRKLLPLTELEESKIKYGQQLVMGFMQVTVTLKDSETGGTPEYRRGRSTRGYLTYKGKPVTEVVETAPIVVYGGRMVEGVWEPGLRTMGYLQRASTPFNLYPEGTALELENLLLTDPTSVYYDQNIALVTPKQRPQKKTDETFEEEAARLQEEADARLQAAKDKSDKYKNLVMEVEDRLSILTPGEVQAIAAQRELSDTQIFSRPEIPAEEYAHILEDLLVEQGLASPASYAGIIPRPGEGVVPTVRDPRTGDDVALSETEAMATAPHKGYAGVVQTRLELQEGPGQFVGRSAKENLALPGPSSVQDPNAESRTLDIVDPDAGVSPVPMTRPLSRQGGRRVSPEEVEQAELSLEAARERLENATTEAEQEAARINVQEAERVVDARLAGAEASPTGTELLPGRYTRESLVLTPPPSPPPPGQSDIPPGVSYTKAAALALSMGDEKGNFIEDLKRIIDKNFRFSRKVRILLSEELEGPSATGINYFTYNEESTYETESGVEVGNPNDYIRSKAAEMNRTNNRGKIISIGDYDVILLNLPREADGSISDVNITEGVLAISHELGHGLFRQEISRFINSKGAWKRINRAFEKARDAEGAPEQYQGEHGLEEWWADNMGIWLLNEARKPTNGVESLFKRVADKLRRFFKDIRVSLQERFGRKIDPDFNHYINQIVASYKQGLNPEETPLTAHNRMVIRNMADSLNEQTGRVIGKKNMRKLNALSKKILSQVQELLPSDRKHWASSWLLAPADNYLRRMGEEGRVIALMLYGRSQSQENPGYLNVITRRTNRTIEDFYSTMGAKDKANPTAEEEASFLEALYEAEQESIATKDLSPQARRAREWKSKFYNLYVKPNNPNVHRRTNFFSRTFNLSEIENNKNTQAELLRILQAAHPKAKEQFLVEAIQAMLRQQEDTDAVDSMSDYSLGMAAERVKLFRDIPNEVFRRGVDENGNINPEGSPDIGLLISPEQAVHRYVENMIKRVEYNRLVKTTVRPGDLTALLDSKGKPRKGFEQVREGTPLRGWRAMEVLINRIEDPVNRQGARDAVMAMLGRTGLGMNNYLRNINSGLLFLNIVTYLTFAMVASLPDLAGPVLRSKSFSALPEAARQLTRYFKNPSEMQQFSRELGVISRDSISSMYINAVDMNYMTEGFRKGSDLFFKVTGTEWFTKFSRTFAAGMGEQFLLKHAKGRTDLDSRYLAELGAGVSSNPRADILAWDKNNRNFNTPEGRRVREMLGRFVDESIIRPNAAERPVWASNPYTALIWQLKSFFYAYGKNILGGHFREMKNRYSETGQISMAAVPLLLGAVTLLPLSMVGLELREGIKWAVAGGDEGKLRTNGMGWWEYAGEIIDRAGYLGPYTLMLPLVGGQTYGGSPLIEPFGPTAERVEDILRGQWDPKDYIAFYASL